MIQISHASHHSINSARWGFRASVTVAITLFLLLLPISSSAADDRLQAFLDKVPQFLDEYLPLDHPDSPFRPYIGRPFEDGLDRAARREFDKAQVTSRCGRVVELLEQGFLALYPFLAPAFEDPIESFQLRERLDLARKPATRRCQAWWLIDWAFEVKPRETFGILDIEALTYGSGKRLERALAKGPFWRADRGWLRLGELAFCVDYLPAIEDVLADANRDGGMRVSATEELYLVVRATERGVASPQRLSRAKSLRDRFAYLPIDQMVSDDRTARLESLSRVSRFWRSLCLSRDESRRRFDRILRAAYRNRSRK